MGINKDTTQVVETVLKDLMEHGKVSPHDPMAFSALAVEAQLAAATFAGYQVLATERMAIALEKVVDGITNLNNSIRESNEQIHDLRLVISSNG